MPIARAARHAFPMLSIRPVVLGCDGRVSPADFGIVAPWWEARGGETPTREMLPGCGAIAEHHGHPIACAFMYLDATGSGVAWLAWLATKPQIPARAAAGAIRLLVDFLKHHAKSLNYWLICASYHQPSLIRTFRKLGFQSGDQGMTQLFSTI